MKMQSVFGKLPTAIQKNPAGTFSFVGSVPIELTTERRNSLGQVIHPSKCFPTEQEAIDALLALGITRFQLADCNWYEKKVSSS